MYWLLALGLSALAFMEKSKIAVAAAAVPGVAAAETYIPGNWTAFDQLFINSGDQWGVDAKWLKAFCLNESNLGLARSVADGLANPSDVSGSTSYDGKSWGIMQVTLATAQQYDPSATPELLNKPDYSVDIAGQLVSDIANHFSLVDPRYTEWCVKSYNQGMGNTDREIAGTGGGYADAYWTRWQSNYNRVLSNLGGLS